MSQQIDLIFGVAGGGNPNGVSGRKIKNQIENIIGNINNSKSGPAYKISNIEISQSSLNKIKNQIESLNVSLKNIQVAGVTSGASKSASKSSDKPLSIKQEENLAWKQFEKEQKELRKQESQLNEMHQRKLDNEAEETAKVEAETAKQIAAYNKLEDAREKKAVQASTDRLKLEQNEQLSREKIFNKVLKSYDGFTNIKDYSSLNQRYIEMIDKLGKKTTLSAEESRHFTKELNRLENDAYQAGVACDTLGEAIEHKISDRLKYLIGQFAIDFVVQGLRRIYDNVLQIDSAMTELKKVTDETGEAYDRFLTNAGKRAKELGASLVEVVNMTADYARLGYDVDEASNLADAAIIYRNVGDGLKNADEATDNLISTMKAFGIEASNSMRIVDAFNEVSNNFAVTSSDIGAGLQRSSAAMAAAGNSMEETIALFTAGNTIIRDADTMGTSLKTISMRLRSTKSDLEAMGEDTDGAAESVSSLRKELLALTGVDIQLDENTYKNTYEILQELSKVWDNLDDLTRANVLEKLFGKRQANVGAAILQNFNIAEEALETAMNSAGSAVAENEKYLESIQGHLDQLTASFQTLSSNVLDSELVKFGVDALRLIVDLLNGIIEAFDMVGLGAIGVAADIMIVAVVMDAAFGLKHVKNILSFIKAAKEYVELLKMMKTVAYSDANMETAQKLVKKYGDETMQVVSKIIDKIKTIPTFLQGSLGATGVGASIFGGILLALPVIIAGYGAWQAKLHDIETTTKKINEQQEEYDSAVSDLDALNGELEENKNRIEELEKIEIPTAVEAEELNLLEQKNQLLADQIELKKQLVAAEKKDIYDSTVEAIDDTWGYTRYGKSSGMQYYSQRQGEVYQEEIDRIQGYIDVEIAKGAEANQELIDYYLEQQAKYEEKYLDWQEAILTAREKLTGATDAEHVAQREALDSIISWMNYQNSDSPIANLLSDSRFTKVVDVIKNFGENTTIKTIESILNPGVAAVFSKALAEAGISLEEFIDLCNKADDEADIEASITIDTEAIEKASGATKTLSSSCKVMADAFKEQNENGALSVDTILDVIDAGYAAALVVDQETGAVKLNAAMYLELAKAKIAQQIIDLQNQRNSLANQLNLINEGKCANFAALGYATLEEAKKSVESHIAALDAQITALNNIDLSKVTQGIYGIGNAASSASSKLSKLQSGMENLLSQTISWLKQEYNDAQEAQEGYYESQIDALEDAKDAAKDRWDAEKEAIEDAKDSYNDLIDAQIELLKRQKEADDYAKSRAEKEDAVADIENQLLAIENDDSIEAQKMRLELQEQLKEAKDELEELQSDREYELREQALQDEKDRYNDEADAKLDAIKKQSEAEEKAYQDRIDRLQKYLDAVRDSEKTEAQWRAEAYDWIENREEELYQHLLEWNYLYGDGRSETVRQWFLEAEGWRAWGNTFEEARNNLAKYLYELAEAAGFVGGAIGEVEEEMADVTQTILDELAAYRDKLAEEGDMIMSKMIDDLHQNMTNAVANGMEFSEEMLNNMRKAIESGDLDCLNAVRRMLGYYNELTTKGTTNFSEMQQFFRIAMKQMDEDAFIILQGIMNNIDLVRQATANMQSEMRRTPSSGGAIDPKRWENVSFAAGGVIDYTGPAAVHGSKSNPEVVFNADAAAKLYNYVVNTPDLLKSAFAGITADSSMLKGASQINNSPRIGDININISGNADADTVLKFKQLAGQLRDEVVKSLNDSMNRRGIMRSPRVI